MKRKGVRLHLVSKVSKWIKSIEDESLRELLIHGDEVVVAGGSIVSLLTDEEVNDYDVYIKSVDTLQLLAEYYANKWNKSGKGKEVIVSRVDDKVLCYIDSEGVAGDKEDEVVEPEKLVETAVAKADEDVEAPEYRPIYFTDNAISLSGGIQIILRFTGEPEEILSNFDYVHCMNFYEHKGRKLTLKEEAVTSILTKELIYKGSKYPLCSLFRMRKYIERGYHVNAGQILKMTMQLNELDLKDISVLKEQLIGVDTTYMIMLVDAVEKSIEEGTEVTTEHVINLIDTIFE